MNKFLRQPFIYFCGYDIIWLNEIYYFFNNKNCSEWNYCSGFSDDVDLSIEIIEWRFILRIQL